METLINFETAKLAKEVGFDWYTERMCSTFYVSENIDVTYNYKSKKKIFKEGTLIDEENYLDETSCTTHNIPEQYWISAPTQSLLQKWMREKYKLLVEINCMCVGEHEVIQWKFTGVHHWKKGNHLKTVLTDRYFNSYEEALEKGLLVALKYLRPRILWNKLGDIPIDEQECIEEKFEHFEIGTHRETIWHWFEEKFNLSVAKDLMKL